MGLYICSIYGVFYRQAVAEIIHSWDQEQWSIITWNGNSKTLQIRTLLKIGCCVGHLGIPVIKKAMAIATG